MNGCVHGYMCGYGYMCGHGYGVGMGVVVGLGGVSVGIGMAECPCLHSNSMF